MSATAAIEESETSFSRHLGIEVLEWGAGRAVIALEVVDRLTNRRGHAHGGVVATLADMALSLAWRGAARDKVAAGTISLNVVFVASGVGRLVAEGRLIRMTGGCAFCDGTVRNADGTVAATAQAVFRVREGRTMAA